MFLESPSNPKVKLWSSLKTKKGRASHRQFLVEGIRLVDELLRSPLEITALLWDVSADEPPASLLGAASSRNVPWYELSPAAFSAVADTVTPQRVIAVAQIPAPSRPSDVWSQTSHLLLLDGVQDPGNVGTLVRSADAFGCATVCCGTGTVDPYSPKVVRASMGGLFRINIVQCDSVECISAWRAEWPDGQVAVLEADGDAVSFATDLYRPSLVVVGSEAFGASEAVRTLATHRVRIPMTGAAESLNAAMAGTVLLYEMLRQRSTGAGETAL